MNNKKAERFLALLFYLMLSRLASRFPLERTREKIIAFLLYLIIDFDSCFFQFPFGFEHDIFQ